MDSLLALSCSRTPASFLEHTVPIPRRTPTSTHSLWSMPTWYTWCSIWCPISTAIAEQKEDGWPELIYRWGLQRLNMEVDLQSLFGLQVTWCVQLYSLAETPQLPPSPRIWTRITRTLLVSKDRRHLFVTPWSHVNTQQKNQEIGVCLIQKLSHSKRPKALFM